MGDAGLVETEYEPFTVTEGELARAGTETAAATARTGLVRASTWRERWHCQWTAKRWKRILAFAVRSC